MKQDREYRTMELRAEGPVFMVHGYASTFDEYTLMSINDVDYKERIDRTAFEGADLSDVVFRLEHEGRVYARSSAGTVILETDEHGLAIHADLSKTSSAREVFEDIAAGNYPKMSFAFTVAEDHYDKATHTRVIDRIAKVFDVSPVSFPANPATSLGVSTRDYFNGVIEMERAERLEEEKREQQKLKIKILLEV